MAQLIDLGALRFVYRGAYNAATAYGVNDVVQYNGALYVVTSDTTVTGVTPTTTAPWAQMLPPGAGLASGTLAARPTTFTGNRLYIVTGDPTTSNNGLAFYDTGSAWVQFGGGGYLRATAAAAADVPAIVSGTNGQIGDLTQWNASATIGTVARVTSAGAVSAASLQATPNTNTNGLRITMAAFTSTVPLVIRDSSSNDVFRVATNGRTVGPVENVTNTYDGAGNLTQQVKTLGGTTVSTTTLTYDGSGNLASTSENADGRTVTRTFGYDAAGNVATVTAAVSANASVA